MFILEIFEVKWLYLILVLSVMLLVNLYWILVNVLMFVFVLVVEVFNL